VREGSSARHGQQRLVGAGPGAPGAASRHRTISRHQRHFLFVLGALACLPPAARTLACSPAGPGQLIADGCAATVSGGMFNTGTGNFQAAFTAQNGGSITAIGSVTLITGGDDAAGIFTQSNGAITFTAIGSTNTTSGARSYGVHSFGPSIFSGQLTIVTNGPQAHAAIAEFGGVLTLLSSSLTTNGDEAVGLNVQSVTSILLGPSSITTSGSGAFGVMALNGGARVIVDSGGAGTLIQTSGAGSHGLLAQNGGLVSITGTTVSVTGAGASALSIGAGPLPQFALGLGGPVQSAIIARSTLSSSAAPAIGVAGPGASILLIGSTVTGNGVFLNVAANGSGPGTADVAVDSSTLTGTAVMASGSATNLTLRNGTVWNVPGTSNLTSLVNDASLIAFTPPGGGGFRALSAINYAGQNGTIGLHTFLAGDGAPSDRLVILGGTATGTTRLLIINAGGPGARTASDGILVVQAIAGGTTAPGAFSLAGRVVGGPYEYLLFRGAQATDSSDNWYLRSTTLPPPTPPVPPTPPAPPTPAPVILYRPEVPVYSAAPGMVRRMTLATLGTFHERRGEQGLLHGDGSLRAGWGRMFGQHHEEHWSGTVNPGFDGTVWGLQAGFDVYGHDSPDGDRDRAGFFFGYARADGNVRGFAIGAVRPRLGDVNLNGYSLGAYWTHLGSSGWYVDAVLMGTWMSGEPTSRFGANAKARGVNLVASLEGGYPVALGGGWSLEPQAQIIGQRLWLDDTRDPFSKIRYSGEPAVTGRLGLRLRGNLEASGTMWQPYLRLNLWHDFKGRERVAFDAEPIVTRYGGTALQIGGGTVAQVTSALSFFATTSYSTNLGGKHRRTITGNLGLQYRW